MFRKKPCFCLKFPSEGGDGGFEPREGKNPIMKNFDVIIVGAGFAGAATAYFLSRTAGLRIALLEREARAGVHASGRNAGMFRQAVPPPLGNYIQVSAEAMVNPPEDWSQPQVFSPQGSVLLGGESLLSGLCEGLRQRGVGFQLLAFGDFPNGFSKSLQELLLQSRYELGLFVPSDGVVQTTPYLQNLLGAAEGRGAKLFYCSEVLGLIREASSWKVRTTSGVFEAPWLVNAAGAWASDLGAWAQCTSELMAHRRHLCLARSEFEVEATWPFVWDLQAGYYFRPESGGLLLSPGDETPHGPGFPEVDPKAAQMLQEKLSLYSQGLGRVSLQEVWACLRTKSASGDFVIRQEADVGFQWVAGLGGHGMSASLGVGKEAARQLLAAWGNGNA